MRKILKLIKSIKNRYVNIIYLLKSVKYVKYILKAENIQITGTGVLQLFFNDYIIKIPLGKLSDINLEKEYQNYLKLQKSNLSKYVDYNLEKINSIYKVEKLKNIKDININKIIQDLEQEKIREEEIIDLSLELLNRWCKKDFEYNFKYEKSVMHGDLTPKNVMLNKNNEVVLIDLDRFTFSGIKGIDKLHFIIEKECKEEKSDFLNWILENFERFEEKEFLLLYFIYRVNMENIKGVILNKSYYKKVCLVYQKFKKKYKCKQ